MGLVGIRTNGTDLFECALWIGKGRLVRIMFSLLFAFVEICNPITSGVTLASDNRLF